MSANRKRVYAFFLTAIFLSISLFISGITTTIRASAQPPEAERIFYIGASTSDPFTDISGKKHQVLSHSDNEGNPVRLVYDEQLHRNVYSFSNGAYFEVPDSSGLLKLAESDVLTIELNMKFHNQISCTPPLPQVILSKGNVLSAYPRNYQFRLYWQGYSDVGECTTGFIPGLALGYGPFAGYFFGPYTDRPLLDWNVFTFRIYKKNYDDGSTSFYKECFINGELVWAGDLPGSQLSENVVDENGNWPPLNIGNGYQVGPELPTFQANPFFGSIDYVRIYKGLLPIEEMNTNPHNALPDLPVPNRPPVALAKDITIEAGANCQASITAAMLNNGSYDPDGEEIGLSVDNLGPFSAGPSGQRTYPVTLTVTDPGGLSATCTANVTVIDVLPPVISLSDPVCVQEGKGKSANKLSVSATDACSGPVEAQIESIKIINNGGQSVNGKGFYSISGNDILVYPNGNGWKVEVTVTASDARGNTKTIKMTKSLLKC